MKMIFKVSFFVIAAGLATILFTHSASAADAKNFNPGRIIDDVVFYNSDAMNATQIQKFLESKNPNCDYNGTQPATDWGRSDITHAKLAEYKRNGTNGYSKDTGFHAPPYKCLTKYTQSTPQMEAASGYCSAISAGTRSAAKIINDVAKACGINPQVLVILLEKEQSLITDDWPLNRQLRNATGFACPDTAPCNPAYEGFFYQVYYAARQFKVYQANPDSYNYIAGRTNRIYWHPDLDRCGNSQVYIENQATAALYIYTPYRPNSAALNNLYGTGDSCSSYGNRNFWRIFTDWFGSTLKPGDAAIQARYEGLDSARKTALGNPTSKVICGISNNGCYQKYTNGAILWTKKTGAWESYGPLRERWTKLGYENSKLGYPVSTIICGIKNNGCYQKYENGVLLWSASTGAWESLGSIRQRWIATGYESGSLGYPTSEEIKLKTGGWYQRYENGYITGKSDTGYWESRGSIRNRWAQLGYEAGSVGYPIGPITSVSTTGWQQKYEHGTIIGKESTGYWESRGSIRNRWAQLGYEAGSVGYPIGPETELPSGGWQQEYEHGTILGRGSTGYWHSDSTIFTRFKQLGSVSGKLGYPTNNISCGLIRDGCYQNFQYGAILWSEETGAWESLGSIRALWIKTGRETGSLGYQTGPEVLDSTGAWNQQYEKGSIKSKAGVAKAVYNN